MIVTARELKKLSSPACSPQYTMTIPAGVRCARIATNSGPRPVVADVAKVINSNQHDLEHYYIWLDDADVVEVPGE